MNKITADYIFPVICPPLKNGVIIYDHLGTIKKVVSGHDFDGSWSDVKKYQGILVPGFINAHTHLELSCLKGQVQTRKGISYFIKQVQEQRKSLSPGELINAMQSADTSMRQNGVVAAGDISNSIEGMHVKQKSHIQYYTFIERFGFDTDLAGSVFEEAIEVKETCEKNYNMPASLSPHAPYSTSAGLIALIAEYCDRNKLIFSIHNQESNEENIMFKNKSGTLYDQLLQFGVSFDEWNVPGVNSLQAIARLLPEKTNCLLVHNTYTTEPDIQEAIRRNNNIYWILAPRANLYIEDKLPPVHLLRKHSHSIALGTDSLASNHSLSILDEIKTIHAAFPGIRLEELLTWATLNGAKALGYDKSTGSFEPGKTPGINLITNVDSNTLTLNEKSNIRVIV